jgi:hypothetical protein
VRSSLIVVAVIGLLGLSTACGLQQGQGTSVGGGTDVVIKQDANGTVVHVQPMDTLHFVLADGLRWRVISFPRDIMRLTGAPKRGRFELQVHGPGAGSVKAMGTGACRSEMRCPGRTVFSVKIYAEWIP